MFIIYLQYTDGHLIPYIYMRVYPYTGSEFGGLCLGLCSMFVSLRMLQVNHTDTTVIKIVIVWCEGIRSGFYRQLRVKFTIGVYSIYNISSTSVKYQKYCLDLFLNVCVQEGGYVCAYIQYCPLRCNQPTKFGPHYLQMLAYRAVHG